jgi:putative DNA primase/helicase
VSEVRKVAAGKWRGLLVSLGIEAKFLVKRNGPCPMCGGKDRWRFTDFESAGCWVCNQCGKGDGIDLLMKFHSWDFRRAATEVEKIVGGVVPDPVRKSKSDPGLRIDRIRRELVTKHPEVTRYLASRGLKQSPALAAHPALGYYDDGKLVGKFPAMVAGILNPLRETVSLHVTYLQDGKKAPVSSPRKILTPRSSLDGGAVRLYQKVGEHLGVAEGIETALAAARLFKVPTWSLLNTTLMEKWEPPAGLLMVTVFADSDTSYAGHKAAYALAFRLASKGLAVEVKVPAVMGRDWNDELLAQVVAA